MDREAWGAAIHGVTESQTRLSDWTELNNTMLTRTWNNRNSHSLLRNMDIQNGTATLHSLTIWSSNHVPWYLSKWIENIWPNKNVPQMFIAALFIIGKAWKPPRYSPVGKWIKTFHPGNGIWFSSENDLSSHEKHEGKVLVTQSCPTLCSPVNYSLPGYSVHGIQGHNAYCQVKRLGTIWF